MNMHFNNEIIELLKKLWLHLSKKRRGQFLLILLVSILSAFIEVMSLGALVPFLGILVSPEKVFNQPMVRDLANIFGYQSPETL